MAAGRADGGKAPATPFALFLQYIKPKINQKIAEIHIILKQI